MKKLGIFNLLEENVCKLKCDCGWNLRIGGENKKDFDAIKKYLKGYKKVGDTKAPAQQ